MDQKITPEFELMMAAIGMPVNTAWEVKAKAAAEPVNPSDLKDVKTPASKTAIPKRKFPARKSGDKPATV